MCAVARRRARAELLPTPMQWDPSARSDPGSAGRAPHDAVSSLPDGAFRHPPCARFDGAIVAGVVAGRPRRRSRRTSATHRDSRARKLRRVECSRRACARSRRAERASNGLAERASVCPVADSAASANTTEPWAPSCSNPRGPARAGRGCSNGAQVSPRRAAQPKKNGVRRVGSTPRRQLARTNRCNVASVALLLPCYTR